MTIFVTFTLDFVVFFNCVLLYSLLIKQKKYRVGDCDRNLDRDPEIKLRRSIPEARELGSHPEKKFPIAIEISIGIQNFFVSRSESDCDLEKYRQKKNYSFIFIFKYFFLGGGELISTFNDRLSLNYPADRDIFDNTK